MKPAALKPPPTPQNTEADRLAIWTFAKLIKGTGGEYPLQNVRIGLQPNMQPDGQINFQSDGTLQSSVSLPKNSRNSKPVPEQIKIQREMKAISAQLRKDADFVTRYHSYSKWADDMAEAIRRLTRLLADLAGKDGRALECFYDTLLVSVIELENLSSREDSLRLIQAEARKQSSWPVLYSPHPRQKRKLDKVMREIGLGEHYFQKLWGARDVEKSPSRQFALRMGKTLHRIYSTPGLKFFLSQQAVGMVANQREKHLLAQGWHLWMIRLCQLPELTKASAPAWFEVGWEALKEATGGNVASIPELAKLGESNVAYGVSIGLKSGAQSCRAKDQIRKQLRKAFLVQFGNPTLPV